MQTHNFPYIPNLGPLAVTTGFFDGVHDGHVVVLRELMSIARQHQLPTCVVTYEPHPRIVLGKENDLQLLTCFNEKKQRLASLGIDHLVVVPFTKELSEMKYEDFFEKYLVRALNTKQLVVGFDHNMGKDALGTFDKIQATAQNFNIDVHRISPRLHDNIEISSTKIRNALREGNMAQANTMLGYPYSITGKVVKGKAIGRTIGYPTANIVPLCNKILAKDGIYAVHVMVGGTQYNGMLDIGTRPTITQSGERSIEVNIFDFSQDIYEQTITIIPVQRLRDEQKLQSLEELKILLDKDKEESLKVLHA